MEFRGVHAGIHKPQVIWTTLLPHPTALPLGSCLSLGESPCSRVRASVKELLHSTPCWEAFGKGKLHWVLIDLCSEAVEGSAGELWVELTTKSSLPQPLFLLRPPNSQICPDLTKSKVCREMTYRNKYLLLFCFHYVWKKQVSFWTQCPCGWFLKNLPVFSPTIFWLNKKYGLFLQIFSLVHCGCTDNDSCLYLHKLMWL